MNFNLPTDLVHFVEGEVASGDYTSSSEVVQDALRLLRHEKALGREKLEILRREITVGLEDVAAGRFSRRTVDEIAAEVEKEHLGE